ncbi:MAG: ribonuclease Z [Candidatus Nanoclepta minutus]|uniref:Ribonuclease Z n=1 Tax=Candidatus Nanoclepta minutus TaxID=1940235 RepID=A0A397WR33_9ARCH|nr:MAG: ribonuclease Z [Candidatus Nanoclepta minutus]
MRVYILGTSGTFPNKRRNHPSVFIEYKGVGIMFDCGEGTQRQIRSLKIKPSKIKYIFLTHWHGDHILGLPGILFSLINMGYSEKLNIFIPRGYKKNLEYILKGFGIEPNFEISIKELHDGKVLDDQEFEIYAKKVKHSIETYSLYFKQKDYIKIDEKIAKELGVFGDKKILKKIKEGKTVEINGKKISYKDIGYIKKGIKVSYITDTLFFEDLIDFVKDSDILISESYYFYDPHLAKEHYHLDFIEVKNLFDRSNSKLLLLMHFSQRYDKEIEMIREKIESENKNIYFLEDLSIIEYTRDTLKLNIGGKIVEYRRDEKTGDLKLISSQPQ